MGKWIAANAQAGLFAGAIGLLTYGLWLERESLAFIIPGGLVAASILALRWAQSVKKD